MFDKAEEQEWRQPWISGRRPVMNLKHKKPYQGFNAFILDMACAIYKWQTPFFLTIDQISKMGLRVKEGEKWTPVLKWLPFYVNILTGERVAPEDVEEGDESIITRFSLRGFCEYNLDQTNLKEVNPTAYEKYVKIGNNLDFVQDVDIQDEVLDFILNTEGGWRCKVQHGGDTAFYSPSGDYITLPPKNSFFKSSDYYSTALHEMAHSTKKVPTMSRDYGRKQWGDEGYATEELVAEITAAIVCHDIGHEKTIDSQHISYVNSWRTAIKNKDILKVIIDDIMKCVRYELNHYNKVSALISKNVKQAS